ncbi:MAG TPA: hypothetical protein V6D17_21640 [Candidatus Obscuribacterales bacterium]
MATLSILLALGVSGIAVRVEAKRLTSSAERFDSNSQFTSVKLDALPSGKLLRQKPAEVNLYEYDTTPLNDRMPLLLVHGLRGEYHPYFRWRKVAKRLEENKEIKKKFKIYMVRYDTTESLSVSVPQFRSAVGRLYSLSGNRPIAVIALSMGGNLAYEAMLDKDTESKISGLMALGTPFHGSPLFCTDWLQYGVYKNLCWPWTRIDHSLAYRWYFNHNPVLMTDLRWDNADNSVPEVGFFKSKLPFGPKGQLTIERTENKRLLDITSNGTNKKKLTTYGGYLVNPYLQPLAERFIESKLLAPYTLVMVKFPAHMAREHPVLKMLNKEIATVVCNREAMARAGTKFVYGLNDGITPLQSALFLPQTALKSIALSRESDVGKLRTLTDVRRARVFKNIDHLTYIDGYHPLAKSAELKDELNPEAGTRHIFDWIAMDLLNMDEDASQVARETHKDALSPAAD